MHEIELRFHIPAGAVEAVRRYVEGRSGCQRQSLAAIYFDTVDRRLARAGLGLRLRKEGRRWVQTCKGPAPDGITRLEHNAPLPLRVAAAELRPELARHQGHPLAEALSAALGEDGAAALGAVFSTRVRRSHRQLRVRGALLELCLDEGHLLAGDGLAERRQPVHELELELVQGSVSALLAHAHQLVTRLPLSLDLRSKAERGERLAGGEPMSPARKAQPCKLGKRLRPGEALHAVLQNAFDQVARNASQVGSGDSRPEHVHQLRVGLRRLRTALRLFRGLWPELEHEALDRFEEQAAAWFRRLGTVRDADVLHTGLSPTLQAALAEAMPDQASPVATPPNPAGGASAAAGCVRASSAQQFLLEWLGWLDALARNPQLVAVPPPAPGVEALPLREGLKRQLRRWQRQVQRDCAQFASLDVEARHRLRKRFKRLRYGSEFAASLFDTKALAEGLRPILKAQELLGELNDLELALDASRARLQGDPRAWFEVGWLAARRSELLERTLPLMAAVADGPSLFKRRR